jgi:hypothetical protein
MLAGGINKYEHHGNSKVQESNYVYFHECVIYDMVTISTHGNMSPSALVVEREDSLQALMMGANVLNKQLRTANRVCIFSYRVR